jgi:hypothetical protein
MTTPSGMPSGPPPAGATSASSGAPPTSSVPERLSSAPPNMTGFSVPTSTATGSKKRRGARNRYVDIMAQ